MPGLPGSVAQSPEVAAVSFNEAEASFLRAFPEYAATEDRISVIREKEYRRLGHRICSCTFLMCPPPAKHCTPPASGCIVPPDAVQVCPDGEGADHQAGEGDELTAQEQADPNHVARRFQQDQEATEVQAQEAMDLQAQKAMELQALEATEVQAEKAIEGQAEKATKLQDDKVREVQAEATRAAEISQPHEEATGGNHVYLDYTGASLYSSLQVEAHAAGLKDALLGNPHSVHPSSLASSGLEEEARAEVLRFFNAQHITEAAAEGHWGSTSKLHATTSFWHSFQALSQCFRWNTGLASSSSCSRVPSVGAEKYSRVPSVGAEKCSRVPAVRPVKCCRVGLEKRSQEASGACGRMGSENCEQVTGVGPKGCNWVGPERCRRLSGSCCREPGGPSKVSEYLVIFTANATGALKLVGEGYTFSRTRATLLLCQDNHSSAAGLSMYARRKGAKVKSAPLKGPDASTDTKALNQLLAASRKGLFVYPAQSNITGVKHSLDWISRAKSCGWDVLLDASAFVPTSRLDLAVYKPDFVAMSFYKIFGYPTGIGCLLVHRSAAHRISLRPNFAGGNVRFASADGGVFARFGPADHRRYEDGTLNFLSFPAVVAGLQHVERVGMDAINARVHYLKLWTLREMEALVHLTGLRLVTVYGPDSRSGIRHSGTLCFNLNGPEGEVIPHDLVVKVAAARNVHIRGGCMCNPGVGMFLLGLTKEHVSKSMKRFKHADLEGGHDWVPLAIDRLKLPRLGFVRASFGIASNFADAYHLVQFLRTFLDPGYMAELLGWYWEHYRVPEGFC